MRVEIDLPNLKHELRPGMHANVAIAIVCKGEDGKGVWTLPASAIIHNKEKGSFFIYRVGDRKLGDHDADEGKAILTPIERGVAGDGTVQVLRYRRSVDPGVDNSWENFTGNERIIMNPTSFADGVKIEKSK